MAPLIVITGPTASGKTGLALELAERFNGEIVCADSRSIYKGMDIGTAKPTKEEQARVPHHLLDAVEPGERYTARDFQLDANQAIADIRSRDKVPFLVGGTGLYIDAVTLDFEWPEQAGASEFEAQTIEELQELIKNQHIAMPQNPQNKRHLVNALRRAGQGGSSLEKPLETTLVVAIATDRNVLRTRIEARAGEMFRAGVIDEAKRLSERYEWDSEAMKSNIYPIVRRVIDGEITERQAIDLFVTKDMRLAKRQVMWLKRHDYVQWLPLDEARRYIETRLG